MRRDLRPNSTASNSSTLMWYVVSASDHKPCVQAVHEAVPQSLGEASEVRVTSGTPLSMDLFADGSDTIHQFKSPMLSDHRDISPSKLPRVYTEGIYTCPVPNAYNAGGPVQFRGRWTHESRLRRLRDE